MNGSIKGITVDSEGRIINDIKSTCLNPKNLDIDAFNALFKKNYVPDPANKGYGDWLEAERKSMGYDEWVRKGRPEPIFSGKYDRDVFNKMFTEHVMKNNEGSEENCQTEGIDLASTFGTEIDRKDGEYSSAFDSSISYTDLKSAYTKNNTICNQVANVTLENRNYDEYKKMRECGL
jgi:hypothetical protein